jgi:hypothetical protein
MVDARPNDVADHRVVDGARHVDVYVEPTPTEPQRIEVVMPSRAVSVAGGVAVGVGILTTFVGCLVWFPGSVGQGGRQDEPTARVAVVTMAAGLTTVVAGLVALTVNPSPRARHVRAHDDL